MTVTIATLAERSLRRLGVTVVPLDDRPTLTEMVPVATIATMALVELGVVVQPNAPAIATIIPAVALATRALVELGVIASDETPSAADQSLAFTRVGAVHDALAGQAITPWTIDTIPQGVSEEYTKLTALVMASSFGRTADPQMIPPLEGRVRAFAQVMAAPVRALDAVASVHAALDAQATVWWSGTAVPRAFVEEYAKLTAAQLASSFGKQIDPAVVAMLEGRVRKGAMVLSSPDIAIEAVMAVHSDWSARDLVRWTVFNIPGIAEMPYEMSAAYLLAGKFGAPANANDLVLAERTIARITALPTSGAHVVAEYF